MSEFLHKGRLKDGKKGCPPDDIVVLSTHSNLGTEQSAGRIGTAWRRGGWKTSRALPGECITKGRADAVHVGGVTLPGGNWPRETKRPVTTRSCNTFVGTTRGLVDTDFLGFGWSNGCKAQRQFGKDGYGDG